MSTYICIMNVENAKAQMKKGILEMCILGIISKGEAYPSDIIKDLKQAELIVVEGTLYPLLNRLKNAGFLDYSWKESKSGPPRKYYKMTENGDTFLKTLKSTWDALVNAVDKTTTNVIASK